MQPLLVTLTFLFFFFNLSLSQLCAGGSEYETIDVSDIISSGPLSRTPSSQSGGVDDVCAFATPPPTTAPGDVTGFIFTNNLFPDTQIEVEVCANGGATVDVNAADCGSPPFCTQQSLSTPIPNCPTTETYSFTVPTGGIDSFHIQFSIFLGGGGFSIDATIRDASSTGGGDPHFRGFHGQKFDFDGVEGHVYNLISDCHIQVNTRFISIRDLTFMGEIGIMTKDHRMLLSPGDHPIVDGEELRESKVYSFSGLNVEVKEDVGHVFVRMEGHYEIKVMYIPWEKYDAGFHNVKVASFGRKGSGIIGHTWKREIEDDLEGRYRVVDGLFGDKFVENLFGDCEDERNDGDVWVGGAEPPSFA